MPRSFFFHYLPWFGVGTSIFGNTQPMARNTRREAGRGTSPMAQQLRALSFLAIEMVWKWCTYCSWFLQKNASLLVWFWFWFWFWVLGFGFWVEVGGWVWVWVLFVCFVCLGLVWFGFWMVFGFWFLFVLFVLFVLFCFVCLFVCLFVAWWWLVLTRAFCL